MMNQSSVNVLMAIELISMAIFSCNSPICVHQSYIEQDTLTYSIPNELGTPKDWLQSDLMVSDEGEVFIENINKVSQSFDTYRLESANFRRTHINNRIWSVLDSIEFSSICLLDSGRFAFLDMEADKWKPRTGRLFFCDMAQDTFRIIDCNGIYDGHSFSTIAVGKTPVLSYDGKSVIIHSPISDISVSDSTTRPEYGMYPMELIIDPYHSNLMKRVGCTWREYWNQTRPDPFPVRCLENLNYLTSVYPFSLTVKKFSFENSSCKEYRLRSDYVKSFERYPEDKQGDVYYQRKYLDRAPAVKNIAFDKFNNLYYVALKHESQQNDSIAWSILLTDPEFNLISEVPISKSKHLTWRWLLPTPRGLMIVNEMSLRGKLKEQIRFTLIQIRHK